VFAAVLTAGVSGAGRSAKEANLYVEIAEGINAYGVTKHRHMPEIEQGLSEAAGKPVTISFTPHLMPISRCACKTGSSIQVVDIQYTV
jgi:N-acetyl-gamma-glutamyl-phosphate reductase